jgi:hypothetical protein
MTVDYRAQCSGCGSISHDIKTCKDKKGKIQ